MTRNITPTQSLLRRLLAGLVFGFVILLALMLVGDIRQVSQQVLSFQWAYFPLVLALTLFNYTLRCFKWHYYLGQIGVRGFPLARSARLFVAGFPLAVTPGKLGEALKGVWLHRETGKPVAAGIAVVVAERISDGLAVLALSTLGVIAYPQFWPAFLAVLVALLGVVIVSQIRPLAGWLLDLGERIPLVKRVIPALRQFYEGSFLLFKPAATLAAVSLGTASWLGEGIGFYLILLGLGLPPSRQALSIAIFTLAFSTIVGALSTLPGGLGAAEASIAGMLVLLLSMGKDAAAAATLLIRFATLWFGVSLGLLVWAFSPDLFRLATDDG
ncbi:MAG: flippase-like domain-containing protein [Anaerolineales bacterium]|nr:flippase-like domain-containing protein [Anaerolineales bacterium]